MPDFITLTGLIATPIKALTTSEGLAITSFRLASHQRRFDRAQNKWVDSETNWYSVTAFRQLATNAALSVHQGDRIVVTGKMHIREWESNGKKGITAEVDAEAIGHDLSWGTAAFSRNMGPQAVDSGPRAVESNPQAAEASVQPVASAGLSTDAAGWATPGLGVVDAQTGEVVEAGELVGASIGTLAARGESAGIETPF
jgi:single-strand DNA-binding protein